jgi:hypothetical protein
LTPDGSFITEAVVATNLYDRLKGSLFKKQEVNVKEMVLMDLKRINETVRDETAALRDSDVTKHEIGKKLLFLFQCDLLPGISGKILELKGSRDSSKVKRVSYRAKVAAWTFLFLMNAGMLFYILLFALTQTGPRQNAWFQSFALWLVVEILLVSTGIVFVTHILVPSLIMKDITQIKRRLMDNIRDFNDKVNATDKSEAANEKEGVSFNAANFLFVSTRMAREFPELKESKIIAQFSTPWPRQSYLHVQNVSKKYSKKFSAFTRSASILLIFFVGNFLSVPPSCQDIVIHMTSTTAIGYIILIHVQLFEIFPALVILPSLVLAVLAHFVIQSSKADAKIKLARLFPVSNKKKKVQPEANGAAGKYADAEGLEGGQVDAVILDGEEVSRVEAVSGEESKDSYSDSDYFSSDDEVAVAVPVTGNAHRTRRQSIQSGLDLIRTMHKQQAAASRLRSHSEISSDHSISSDSVSETDSDAAADDIELLHTPVGTPSHTAHTVARNSLLRPALSKSYAGLPRSFSVSSSDNSSSESESTGQKAATVLESSRSSSASSISGSNREEDEEESHSDSRTHDSSSSSSSVARSIDILQSSETGSRSEEDEHAALPGEGRNTTAVDPAAPGEIHDFSSVSTMAPRALAGAVPHVVCSPPAISSGSSSSSGSMSRGSGSASSSHSDALSSVSADEQPDNAVVAGTEHEETHKRQHMTSASSSEDKSSASGSFGQGHAEHSVESNREPNDEISLSSEESDDDSEDFDFSDDEGLPVATLPAAQNVASAPQDDKEDDDWSGISSLAEEADPGTACELPLSATVVHSSASATARTAPAPRKVAAKRAIKRTEPDSVVTASAAAFSARASRKAPLPSVPAVRSTRATVMTNRTPGTGTATGTGTEPNAAAIAPEMRRRMPTGK